MINITAAIPKIDHMEVTEDGMIDCCEDDMGQISGMLFDVRQRVYWDMGAEFFREMKFSE